MLKLNVINRRNKTKSFKLGSLDFGGNDKIYLQSMSTLKTSKVDAVCEQVNELIKLGCEIIRFSVVDIEDLHALPRLISKLSIPIIADIHFKTEFAIKAIKTGIAGIRINPGNFKIQDFELITVMAKDYNCAIRIGINTGSFAENVTNDEILDLVDKYLKIGADIGYYNFCLSFKSSDLKRCEELNLAASERFDYPIHLGVTEAGPIIKSTVAHTLFLERMLNAGIGNTIRVSISDEPYKEMIACREILKYVGLRNDIIDLISCPTCGRIAYDMLGFIKEVEVKLYQIFKPIRVAIMGCIVNGLGESRNSQISLIGLNNNSFNLYKDGVLLGKIERWEIVNRLIEEINNY